MAFRMLPVVDSHSGIFILNSLFVIITLSGSSMLRIIPFVISALNLFCRMLITCAGEPFKDNRLVDNGNADLLKEEYSSCAISVLFFFPVNTFACNMSESEDANEQVPVKPVSNVLLLMFK